MNKKNKYPDFRFPPKKLNKCNIGKVIITLMYLLVILIFSTSCTMTKMLKKEIDYLSLQNEMAGINTLNQYDLDNLPCPVQKWLKHSGMDVNVSLKNVWLTQKVNIKMKPEQQNWYKAKAEQSFTIDNPGFIWIVKMKMSPIIKIKGRDKFVDGKGEMLIRMNSILNIVNEKGSKIDEASMQRFLGEIVWFPSAALSPYIKWEAIDSLSAKATMDYKGTKAYGIFNFNEQGAFVKYTALRYLGNEADAQLYEWVIEVSENAIINGVNIPVKMTATWKLDEGDWNWLEIELIDIKYNTESFIKHIKL